MLILILFLTSWNLLPKWQDIVIGIIAAEGVAHLIMAEELKEKADKGEATAEDAMAALMLAAIMKKESKED